MNEYGKLVGTFPDNIKKGDMVEYIDTKNILIGKIRKMVKVPLQGIWDGNQVIFDDKEQTTVRTIWWLTKKKNCPKCGQELK